MSSNGKKLEIGDGRASEEYAVRTLEITLIEWPHGREAGGPRLLGCTSNPSLISRVQSELAEGHRVQIADLEECPDPGMRLGSNEMTSVDLVEVANSLFEQARAVALLADSLKSEARLLSALCDHLDDNGEDG